MPPHTDCSIVFPRLRQCALPWGHSGVTWRIRLNLCFLRPTRVHNPNGKLIGSAIFVTANGIVSSGMPGHVLSPNNCLFAWRIWAPSNTCLLWSTQVYNPNGISIGSAVFAQITAECRYSLQRAAPFSLKITPSHGGSGPI